MALNPTPSNGNILACHVLITGRVQGVYYRYSLQQQAQALGLRGWCRNIQDGSVEALLLGHPEAINAVVQWCHQGPPHAQVDHVEVTPLDKVPDNLSDGFEIRQ